MTYDFCTLFDTKYLPRGLVTHRSLREVLPEAHTRVLCMDARVKRLLDRLAEPGLEAIAVEELERADPALAGVKPGRSRAEYCWTSTPALCRFVLDREPQLQAITYIDADLIFFASPEPLFAELGDDSVLIVPHRYAPQWAEQELPHGIYNVEWLTFRRDRRAEAALDWWHERCIEWCYARAEDGKFGDQKYLDDWPQRFEGVHVLAHPGGGLAPWNVPRHRLERSRDGSITVDGRPLVFFHAHSLALHRAGAAARSLAAVDLPLGPRLDEGVAWTTNYPVGRSDRDWIWVPYIRRLLAAAADIRRADPSFELPLVPVDRRKIAHAAAIDLHRRVREVAASARSLAGRRNGATSSADWQHGAASEMLALVRQQLQAPDVVPPFRGFRYALEAVLADADADRPLDLLDIGCGVGHYSELVERWFPGEIAYTGADVSAEMVTAAATAWPGRRFERDDVLDRALDYDAYDVLLAGALVDVLAEWRRALDAILGSAAPYVILHRQRLSARKSRVGRAPGYAGGTTYRTVLSESELAAAFARHGREILLRVPIEPGVATFALRSSAA